MLRVRTTNSALVLICYGTYNNLHFLVFTTDHIGPFLNAHSGFFEVVPSFYPRYRL